jgi:hypothetical protein
MLFCATFHITACAMKRYLFILAGIALLLFSGCQSRKNACPQATGTRQYLTTSPEALSTPTPGPSPTSFLMKVNGRPITIDRIVEGPLCNDTWSGTVYVTCNVQVYSWQEDPTFLRNCNLSIAPGTVVYVAYHNNAAYYNGCSCHTGEIAEP